MSADRHSNLTNEEIKERLRGFTSEQIANNDELFKLATVMLYRYKQEEARDLQQYHRFVNEAIVLSNIRRHRKRVYFKNRFLVISIYLFTIIFSRLSIASFCSLQGVVVPSLERNKKILTGWTCRLPVIVENLLEDAQGSRKKSAVGPEESTLILPILIKI